MEFVGDRNKLLSDISYKDEKSDSFYITNSDYLIGNIKVHKNISRQTPGAVSARRNNQN